MGEIPADAVTADLRTNGNALSFWRCETGNRGEFEDAALAIAASGDRIDKLEVVWIAEEELRSHGQTLKDTDGHTPISSLRKRHVDVHKLDYVRLGDVAQQIVVAIESDRYLRLTKKTVTNLLVSAVQQKNLNLDKLNDKVREEVTRSLETSAEP